MTVEQLIRGEIEDRIRSGALRPGDRIPFEHELVITYSCSRATVSKALGTLAKAGLIERRRKAGSFVAHPQVHSAVLEVPDLAELVAARGESYRWELADARPATDAEAGKIASPALFVSGRHLAGGEPLAIERRVIALGAVPEAETASFETVAPGTWLLQHVPWTSARHTIRAVRASRRDTESLALPAHAACLEIERQTWRSGETITHVRQLFRGDRFDLVAEFRPGA